MLQSRLARHGHVTLRITIAGTDAESVMDTLVRSCPGFGLLVVSRNPVTENPPPLKLTLDGVIAPPAFGGVGNATVYGGVPPVITQLNV